MTTYNDTNIAQPITFNKLTATQFDNATSIANDELYLVDPEFLGGKILATNVDGDIAETDVATTASIDAKTSSVQPIVPSNLDYAVKSGVTTNTNTLTTSEQEAACEWLGAGQQVILRDWS